MGAAGARGRRREELRRRRGGRQQERRRSLATDDEERRHNRRRRSGAAYEELLEQMGVVGRRLLEGTQHFSTAHPFMRRRPVSVCFMTTDPQFGLQLNPQPEVARNFLLSDFAHHTHTSSRPSPTASGGPV